MNQYRLTFQLGRKRLSRTVKARNYDGAERVGDKIAKDYKRQTGEWLKFLGMQRLPKTSKSESNRKQSPKRRYGVTDAIGNALDFWAGVG